MKTLMKIAAASCVLAAALAATAGPASAAASLNYGVGTSAATGQYLDNYGGVAGSVSAYRMGRDSSGNYTNMTDTAPVSFDNCVPTACIAASHGGTTGPGFAQTFSTSNSGLIYNGGYGPWQSSASTYANLATGKLGAVGSTDYYQTAFTAARFVDTLNFNVAGADASTVTNIVVKFQLDGGLSTPRADGASGLGTPTAFISDNFGFGAANAGVSFDQSAANSRYGAFEQTLNTRNGQTGWISYSWDTISPGLTQFTGIYALSGISQTLGISNSLSGYTSTGGRFSYGSTSSLNFVLPSNVTFTSASGVFLTGLSATVPEPGTWAMMLAGFGLAGGLMRRRRAVGLRAI